MEVTPDAGHQLADAALTLAKQFPHWKQPLAAAEFARRPDLLKVDIDQADCEVLCPLLEIFEPLVLHLEINPLFPPPVVYREHWRGRNSTLPLETSHHLIGCSLQAMIECTRRRWGARAEPEAYWLHHVEFENAVLVHPDAVSVLPQFQQSPPSQSDAEILDLYVAGYFCHPLRGILSMRETLAEYDFRAWMDPSLSLKQKGGRMWRFLQREWKKVMPKLPKSEALPRRLPYTLSWEKK
ncbi:unnamed protein product, partial [Cladocopium goreaui]